MRVGILSSFYPQTPGGAEVGLGFLLRGLREREVDYRVFSLGRPVGHRDLRLWTHPFAGRLPDRLKILGPPLLDIFTAPTISKYIVEDRIDLLHVQDTYALRCAWRAVGSLRIPVLLSYHNNVGVSFSSFGIPFPANVWLGWREKTVLAAAAKTSLIIADSEFTATQLAGAGVPSGRIRSVYIGGAIDVPGSVGPSKGSSRLRVLGVGRVHRHKGFQTLISATERMLAVGRLLEVTIVGDGPYSRSLRHLTKRLGLAPFIRLVGHVSPSRIEQLYRWSDIVVVPSLTPEPFGRVTVEAFRSARPVVGSAIGGIPEVITPGETGFLVTPGDPSGLARAIERFIHEPRLREQMGMNALRECRRRFEYMTITDQVIDSYRDVFAATNEGS